MWAGEVVGWEVVFGLDLVYFARPLKAGEAFMPPFAAGVISAIVCCGFSRQFDTLSNIPSTPRSFPSLAINDDH